MTEIFTFEAQEELEETEKRKKSLLNLAMKPINENCVANKDTRACSELLLIDD